MAETSLLPDELLQHLMAVGQVDVLVGIPTLDNAATIAQVVTAVHHAFARYFPRERTVLINSDGGSSDGTPAIVRDLSLDESGTLTLKHSLRTVHRISTPYHGLPGKGSALRQIFAAADLLQARAVAILDADVTSVAPEWIPALVRPVLAGSCEFVAPIYARHPLDGPLVTQLVRPVVRAAYGWRIAEPLAAECGCSGRFASHCLEQDVWDTAQAQNGIDLWLTCEALAAGFASGQAALGPRSVAPGTARPALAEVFTQVLGALVACLERQASIWLAREGSSQVPLTGPPPIEVTTPPPFDAERLLQAYGANLRDLRSILQLILDPQTEEELIGASGDDTSLPRFPDELWVATVYQFLAAHHHGVMRREHVTQALLPLYLGRTGSFLAEQAGREPAVVEAALESLSERFERSKPYLVERWRQARER
jgi:hypothetical protein